MTYPYEPGPPDPYQPPPNDPPPQPQPYYAPQPMYPYGYPQPRQTEGFAIASLVISCAAVLGLCAYGLGGILGIIGAIFGHVARRRIARQGTDGGGMALAGIIVGWIAAGLMVAFIVIIIIVVINDPNIS